jgi:hypothetical protein
MSRVVYQASHICVPIEISLLKSSSRRAIAVNCFEFPLLSTMRRPSAISRLVAQPTTNLLFHPSPPTFLISYSFVSEVPKDRSGVKSTHLNVRNGNREYWINVFSFCCPAQCRSCGFSRDISMAPLSFVSGWELDWTRERISP